jgi:hypothetical protein
MLSPASANLRPTTGVALHRAGLAIVCAFMLVLPLARGADKPLATTDDGLQQVKSRKLDLLYVLPGATLGGYNKVWLSSVDVAFHKSWKPDPRKVTAEDRERIRKELADEFQRIFKQELEEKGRYTLVNEAGPDVLRVLPAIVDLYINAPDTSETGRTKVFAVSPGEMTLIAELRDAETGALLARVEDHKGRSFGPMQWTTRAANVNEARRILREWAVILRNGLDAARGRE